ncbi:MAG: MATE family efflux transporter [Oscillospiraceae bacterium]
MLKRYIGDRKFYKMTMAVAVPIMIQNFITNFVSMLDNVMVGQVGTAQMSGVAIVNQVLLVLNLCIFGAVSGAGIFTAQFAGSKDHEGVRYTFRYKLIACLLLVAVGMALLMSCGEQLVSLYLKGEGSAEEAELYLKYGMDYLRVMFWGLVPFAISNVYCSTLRENGETVVPMASGVIAVGVNLALNYILIFGHFGAPAMGVKGAALATVISRYVELVIAAFWTHTHKGRMPFAEGLYRTFKIPSALAKRITTKGMPLVINEGLWSAGMAILNQCYSLRGLEIVAAANICSTIWNAMSVSFLAMGNAVGIIIGQKLGAGRPEEEVRDTDRKLIAFSIVFSALCGCIMAAVSGVFPRLYNTTDDVREIATKFICVMAFVIPFHAYTNAAYFTLRSGGKTIVTFLFDSCYVWCVCVPLAYCLSRFTGLPVVPLYFICQATEMVKCFLGGYMLHRGEWMQNIIYSE